MKTQRTQFENRAAFAEAMYLIEAPNNVVSDVGAGFGHLKYKVRDLDKMWQPFDYVKKNRVILGLES